MFLSDPTIESMQLAQEGLKSTRSRMLRHFPQINVAYAHRKRDYVIAAFTFFCVAICMIFEVSGSVGRQYALGVIALVSLVVMLLGENREVRMQVIVAVAFTRLGEYVASVYMGGYTYRFENVPAYVPLGHGMVYLTSIALARSGLFLRYARAIATSVILMCGAWSIWGISGYAEHGDSGGAVLFCAFVVCLFNGRSPLVYLAAFFITTWLELVGTAAGAWKWAVVDPVFGLSQGNPPSGVAVWYCLVDAVALGGGPLLYRGLKNASEWCKSKGYSPKRVGGFSVFLNFRGHAREAFQAQILLLSQAISTSLKKPDHVVEPLDKT
jgi:hypothetical protein